jgi:vitamin B12 transporter
MQRQGFVSILFCIFYLLSPLALFAQTDSLQKLQEVRLQGFPLREYAIGTKHFQLDSIAKRQAIGQTLAQTLMEQTGIYLKQYGASGIATISFRGTGAGHTAVLWNDLPINSFTLGLSDFNAIPMSATSQVVVSHGAGSALYGSGSIGGSIQLFSSLPDSAQPNIQVQTFGGSFGNIGGQLAYSTRQKHWAVKQVFFAQTAQNDFPFVNTAKFDLPTERQQNAQTTFKGTQTELYFLPTSKHEFSLKAWIQSRQAQLSPTMNANLQAHLYTQSHQNEKRFLGSWKHLIPTNQAELELKIGYMDDLYVYDLSDSTHTQTWLAMAQFKTRLTHNLHLRAQSSHTFITALTDNFDGTKKEARQEIGAGLHWQPLTRLLLALNLRQMWVQARAVPFTPSLGAEYKVGKAWRVKGFVGKTYRVPTLNDKFWATGGNPFLRPENGWTSEIGLQFAYLLWVQDWILWSPLGNIWTPQNLSYVRARGVELQTSAHYKHRHWQVSQGLAYAYTQSLTEGKQLAYTPYHRANAWLQASYKKCFLYQSLSFTSLRYNSLTNTDAMPAFLLWNISAGKSFRVGKQHFSTQLRINNLLNTQYQNYENRAMPRRNLLVVMSYEL